MRILRRQRPVGYGRRKQIMTIGRSITFDDENLGNAIVSASSDVARPTDSVGFIEKLRSRDAVAFDQLVTMHASEVNALLYRLTGDREEAADLVQETFLKALRSIGSFRGDCSLKTWLFRIAINESRNRFRWWKRRRRETTFSLDSTVGDSETAVWETMADDGVSPEEAAIRRERSQRLEKALGELKAVYREVVTLCDIEGLSYEECANALDTNVGTVKSRLSRGREELRKRLNDL